MRLLEQNYLYKGKILVADYQTYCKIIENKTWKPSFYLLLNKTILFPQLLSSS